MLKLIKLFDALGEDAKVIITEGEEDMLYSGTCGKCTKQIWGHAYVISMEFNTKIQRYIIDIRYM